MVKTLSIALVCGIALVAHSYAQEVFSGDQKAKPKYPKAQPAAADHSGTASPKEKAVAVQSSKKPEDAQKPASVTKLVVAQKTKTEAPAAPASKTAVAAGESAKKTVAPTSNETANKVSLSSKISAVKAAPVPSVTHEHEPVSVPVKKVVLTETDTAKKAAPVLHKDSAPTKASPIAAAKSDVEAPPTVKPAPLKVRSATAMKPSVSGSEASRTIATVKSPKIETAAVKAAVVAPPAEGPRHDFASAHGTKKSPVVEAKPASTQKGTTVAIHPAKEADAEESDAPRAPGPKPAVAALPATKKAMAPVRPAAENRTVTASSLSSSVRREAVAPARSLPGTIADAETTMIASAPSGNFETAFTKLADGFDFPVGKPDAQGYYKARGFRSGGHLGEDWDGVRGGDTDLGDPIYSIGDGLVVFARDCHMGWGNVLIVRHSYREGGTVKTVDALYGHLNSMLVRRGQAVARGQKIATMGTAHGLYDAHLHLEVRKNLEIGMSRAAFARDFSNYYDPTQFIQGHRHLQTGGGTYRVAMNTFTRDARIKWDKARNFSHAHTGGGTSESAAALKRALAAKP